MDIVSQKVEIFAEKQIQAFRESLVAGSALYKNCINSKRKNERVFLIGLPHNANLTPCPDIFNLNLWPHTICLAEKYYFKARFNLSKMCF